MKPSNSKLFYEPVGDFVTEPVISGYGVYWSSHPAIQQTFLSAKYRELGYPLGKSIRGFKKFTKLYPMNCRPEWVTIPKFFAPVTLYKGGDDFNSDGIQLTWVSL